MGGAGGFVSAGIGAIATKAAAGLAVAGLVTAGAVEVSQQPARHSKLAAVPHHAVTPTAPAVIQLTAPVTHTASRAPTYRSTVEQIVPKPRKLRAAKATAKLGPRPPDRPQDGPEDPDDGRQDLGQPGRSDRRQGPHHHDARHDHHSGRSRRRQDSDRDRPNGAAAPGAADDANADDHRAADDRADADADADDSHGHEPSAGRAAADDDHAGDQHHHAGAADHDHVASHHHDAPGRRHGIHRRRAGRDRQDLHRDPHSCRRVDGPLAPLAPLLVVAEPDQIDIDQFQAVDMRVGRVVSVDEFPEARVPAWKLTIDFGPEIGMKRSSAQIAHYTREELEGR